MTRRYLIAVVVLAAGCEQLKSPQRIKDLEGRVNELTTEVAALKTGSGSKAKPDEHAGSGSAAEPGASADNAVEGTGHDDHAATVEPTDAGTPDANHEDDALARLRALAAKTPSRPDVHQDPHWSYDDKTGPAQWSTLDPAWAGCKTGTAQSPIDIEPRSGSASPITFRYKPTPATIIDNGHTLQVNLAPGNTIEIDGKSYALLQFHFHTPSEHMIAGEHYPLEVHLVHRNAEGKLAVVGVLFDAGADSRPLAGVWSRWPHKISVEDKLARPFDPSTLLPVTRTVFRYTGSLTTPPCSEGVVWNVMRRTLSDGKPALAAFARHYPHNARDVQALNERKIE